VTTLRTANLRTELMPYQRALWQIAYVKTCHAHTVTDMTPSIMHDRSRQGAMGSW
jgi:hypothetical protein